MYHQVVVCAHDDDDPVAEGRLRHLHEVPQLDADTRRLIAPLARVGSLAIPAVWTDPDVDWAGLRPRRRAVVLGLSRRRREFLKWAVRARGLADPVRARVEYGEALLWATCATASGLSQRSGCGPDKSWSHPQRGPG